MVLSNFYPNYHEHSYIIMQNKRNGCINRDKNGCKNIQKMFNYYIEYDERPEIYKRGFDLQKLHTALTEPSNCS